MSRRLRWTFGVIAILLAIGAAGLWIGGTVASWPAQRLIGAPPADLPAESISIPSTSGSRLAGWFIHGQPHAGAVMLLHGVGANRREMLGRARLLHAAGFAVLLFDFQAHGESPGDAITFGYREAKDARAAFDELRRRAPGERVAVDGLSLGGAAAILSDPPLEADAMVLEAVYASFAIAVENRVAMHLGFAGPYLAPPLTTMLLWQVKPRLGFEPDILQPATEIARLHMPLLLIAGDADQHATLAEMKSIYANATAPKELWIIPGAHHQDFLRYAPAEYERRVVAFLRNHLRDHVRD
jgi:pimeloyl-ACP methyl ester carboxylesterase